MTKPCEVCDNPSLVPLFIKDTDSYEKCPVCGLIRIHPQPSDDKLDSIYQGGYFNAWGNNEEIFHSLKWKTFTTILNMIPECNRRGKLLDVGAATGILMELAQKLGWDPYGVEAARDGAADIARKFGADHIFAGYFDQVNLAEAGLMGSFDIVTMVDLIEHVRDPNETLRRAYSLLKQEGYLVLCLPDTSSFTAHIFGNRWNYYATEHLFSFSKNCISRILRKNGFQVIRLGPAPKYLTMEYSYNVLGRIPGSIGLLRPLLALAPTALKRIPIPLYIGQMKVLAYKDAKE